MTFPFKNLFAPKKFDQPWLALDDPRWVELEGGYRGSAYDASISLSKLEQADDLQKIDEPYQDLWDHLHHQGDVGLASYYAVPHLVRIALEKKLINHHVLGLVSLIEIQRHKKNPSIPTLLLPAYSNALGGLLDLAQFALSSASDLETINTALTAIAVSKGHVKLANAIQNLDSEDVIDEFLEQY